MVLARQDRGLKGATFVSLWHGVITPSMIKLVEEQLVIIAALIRIEDGALHDFDAFRRQMSGDQLEAVETTAPVVPAI